MKKIIRRLLCLGLLLQFFVFIPQVFADGFAGVSFNGEPIVKQGNTILQKENDVYIASGYEDIKVYYTLNGYNSGSSYGSSPYIKLENETWGCDSTYYYSGAFSTCRLNFMQETENYTLKICDDYQCDTSYDTREFSIKYSKYEDIQDDKIYFTNLSQGGEDLVLDDDSNYFTLNKKQNAIFSITGDNLDENANYYIMCGDNSKYEIAKTGAEIMEGTEYICNISKQDNNITPSYRIAYHYETVLYQTQDVPTSYTLVDDSSLPDYESTLKYTNYPNVGLKKVIDDNYTNDYHYLVRSKYANENNTLSYYIAGTNFQNREYDIDLKVLSGSSSIYTRQVKVNGSLLNSGYNLELTGLDLGTITNVRYKIQMTINYITTETDIEYIYPDKEIYITGIKQGEHNLEKQGDIYIAPYTNSLNFQLEIEDYDANNDDYYIKISTESGKINNGYSYEINRAFDVSPNFDNETEELTVSLCNNYMCDKIYTFETVKVKLLNFNQLQNQKIYFYDVKQGSTTIEPNSTGRFSFNDKQDINLKVKGSNLIADQSYIVSTGNYYKMFLGSELEEGIEITNHVSELGYFNINFYMEDVHLDEYYYDGENYIKNGSDNIYFTFKFNTGSYAQEYEAVLKYKNYPDVEMDESENYYNNYYIINSLYHGENNPLSYVIYGNNYEDRDYEVKLWVIRDEDTQVFTMTKEVNGLDLNNGYEVELENFVLPLITELNDDQAPIYGMPVYKIYISIDAVSNYVQARYNSLGRDVFLHSEIFFENGKKNLAAFRGFGNSGMYDTNKDVFNKYSKIYINFLGENFVDDEEYTYILQYGQFTETDYDFSVSYPTNLKNGTVTGKILNNVGVFFELRNDSHYEHPTYRMLIKKGDEIVMYSAPVIYTVDMATLGSVMLSNRNKNLYLRTSDYSYIATRNMPVNIEVSGIGFDNEKEYDFDFCYMPVYGENDYSDETCLPISLLGEDLNNGTATIDFEEEIDENATLYSFYVYGGGDEEEYFGQGGFSLSFVENSDLFPNITRYIIDDATEIIKNIRKNTTVEQFKENLGIAEGNDVKIFDKTGQNEITGKVGTGMQGVVQDEYERNIINIDIAVKGDTSGDGNISVTDLVKVKRHLASIEELEDLYIIAGNVTGTGTLSATDLVQISQDVTKIMEMQ